MLTSTLNYNNNNNGGGNGANTMMGGVVMNQGKPLVTLSTTGAPLSSTLINNTNNIINNNNINNNVPQQKPSLVYTTSGTTTPTPLSSSTHSTFSDQENYYPNQNIMPSTNAANGASLITKSMVIRPPLSAPSTAPVQQQQQQQQPPQQQQLPQQPEEELIIQEVITSNGTSRIKKYKQGEFLGKGGFAKCYLMTDLETNKVYAAKITPKSSLQKSRARAKLKTEIKIHSSLNHENIVKFEHVFETEENVYILLGLCNQKTVMDIHKKRKFLMEYETKYYVYQVIMAVQYLHQHKVIHRDLKLGNLFIDNMRIKLGDFGLSTKVEHDGERKKTICGTPNYIAPEILENLNGHSYEVDVWSIGIILYTLLIGKPPFETPDVRNTYQRIKQNQYSFPDEAQISTSAKNLIISILNPQPEKRPNLSQILEHDFFCLSTIPKYLPVSSLTVPPTRSPSASQMMALPPALAQRSTTTSPKKSCSFANPTSNLSPNSQQKLLDLEKDDFHYRKLRRLEKMKENDMKTKILKQQFISTSESSTSIATMPTSVKELETKIANNHISDQNEVSSELPRNLIYITKYADFSNKYGLSYVLSNGFIGSYFNDSTKIISFIDSGIAHYMEHAKGTEGDGRRILNINDNHPHDTQKKVTLIKYFSNHFINVPELLVNNSNNNDNNNRQFPSDDEINQPVYVKKWIKSPKGIAFRLSDKTIQVYFLDKSMIIITKDQIVTYISSMGDIKTAKLAYFISNPVIDSKIVSRIKYTRDLLYSLHSKKPDQMFPSSPAK
ncbi:hypothetical protein CYY_004477 [Polysphondylium violaceum]|uniref:Serine/threonine-protein kinase PLK n=1 Tax=Polysphondylium violaceum TaxID=133409 RepID=A0A8J4Q5B5_9MYCE|nr:hypothetical protein CYY_004477 [Polysphondylium violaceum]